MMQRHGCSNKATTFDSFAKNTEKLVDCAVSMAHNQIPHRDFFKKIELNQQTQVEKHFLVLY
jgi:hypothetical protein